MKFHDIVSSVLFLALMFLLWAGIELLVWVIFVPLIVLALKGSFRGIIFFGSIVILLTGVYWLSWIMLYDVKTFLLALFSCYVFFMTFVLVTRLLNRTSCSVLIPPTVWFCAAKITSFTPAGSCWTDFAMFQPMMAPLIWFVGARGVTFLVVMVNTVIALLFVRKSKGLLIVGIVLLLGVIGCIAYSSLAEPEGKPLKVAALQGNFSQPWEWRCAHAGTVILDTYLNMTRQAACEKPDIILWPEYAIPEDVFLEEPLLRKISAAVKDSQSYLVFGTLIWHKGTVDGMRKRNDVAAVVSSDGGKIDKYVSVLPLPYEKCTLPGNDLHVINTEKARLGILLCFEETISGIAGKLTLQGAELLVSLANNSRFEQTRGIYFTSLQTRLRAAENRKYLVRATNTGITQVINPYGKIVAAAEPFGRTIVMAEIYLNNRKTFYSRYGDLLIPLFIGVIFLISAIQSSLLTMYMYRFQRENEKNRKKSCNWCF